MATNVLSALPVPSPLVKDDEEVNDHYSQKNHCNDIPDSNDIIALLDKFRASANKTDHLVLRGAIMLHDHSTSIIEITKQPGQG